MKYGGLLVVGEVGRLVSCWGTVKVSFFFVCFLLLVLHASQIALSYLIGAHGIDVSVGVRLLSGETLLQVKNFTGHRWDLNPGPCR